MRVARRDLALRIVGETKDRGAIALRKTVVIRAQVAKIAQARQGRWILADATRTDAERAARLALTGNPIRHENFHAVASGGIAPGEVDTWSGGGWADRWNPFRTATRMADIRRIAEVDRSVRGTGRAISEWRDLTRPGGGIAAHRGTTVATAVATIGIGATSQIGKVAGGQIGGNQDILDRNAEIPASAIWLTERHLSGIASARRLGGCDPVETSGHGNGNDSPSEESATVRW